MTVFFCSAAIDRVAAGVLPLANARARVLDVFVFALPQSHGWIDFAAQFAAMGTAAVVVGKAAIEMVPTLSPLASRRVTSAVAATSTPYSVKLTN